MRGDSDAAIRYAVMANRGILFDMECSDVLLWFVAAHAKRRSEYFFMVLNSLHGSIPDIPESLYRRPAYGFACRTDPQGGIKRGTGESTTDCSNQEWTECWPESRSRPGFHGSHKRQRKQDDKAEPD